jgi:hexosaminidase
MVDIQNPCWIARKVDLAKVHSLVAAVGQIPFNFQIGEAASKISFPAPTTPEGELQVRLGSCDGKVVASLPLAPAVKSDAVTVLPRAPIEGEGVQDLCFRFSQRKLDPIWVIDWIDFGAPS